MLDTIALPIEVRHIILILFSYYSHFIVLFFWFYHWL